MRPLLSILAITALLGTAQAYDAPTVTAPTTDQTCGCPLQAQHAQAVITVQDTHSQSGVVIADAQHADAQVHQAGFFATQCCGGGGWGQVGLRSPLLYLSLAFIALLYVNRRSLLRAIRRQQLRTA